MVTVKYKLGKKKLGNWRLPVEYFYAEFTPPEPNLLIFLEFWKKYVIPGYIYFGGEGCDESCYSITGEKVLDFSFYLRKEKTIFILNKMGDRNGGVYLECREGNPPDYSDFEQLFQQIANDIIEAYNKAVKEALNYGETEEKEFCVSNEYKIDIIQQQEKAKPVRKINL